MVDFSKVCYLNFAFGLICQLQDCNFLFSLQMSLSALFISAYLPTDMWAYVCLHLYAQVYKQTRRETEGDVQGLSVSFPSLIDTR